MDKAAENILFFAALIYFAPALLALIRGHLSSGAIVVLNIALGWTLLGWFIALLWSLTGNTRRNMSPRQEPIGLRAIRYFAPESPAIGNPRQTAETSAGEALDVLAAQCGVTPRRPGEPDPNFRARIMRVAKHAVWV